mmetsp:Transcript_12012/g.18125  ORF Transcript_12012/g.18125 Transcript_12012/m.18125 type:complete len:207 (+) Transcript_12012:1270-1890(+)
MQLFIDLYLFFCNLSNNLFGTTTLACSLSIINAYLLLYNRNDIFQRNTNIFDLLEEHSYSLFITSIDCCFTRQDICQGTIGVVRISQSSELVRCSLIIRIQHNINDPIIEGDIDHRGSIQCHNEFTSLIWKSGVIKSFARDGKELTVGRGTIFTRAAKCRVDHINTGRATKNRIRCIVYIIGCTAPLLDIWTVCAINQVPAPGITR